MKAKIEIGDVVVLNNTADATLWLITETEGDFLIGIVDVSKGAPKPSTQKVQWIDVCFVKPLQLNEV